MSTSLKFKFIGENTNKLLEPILKNQNILRYVKYLNNNPLDPALPDIDVDLIEDETVILTPFYPKVVAGERVLIFFNPDEGYLSDDAMGSTDYIMDIVVPINYWKLSGEGEYRAFMIAYEVAKEIDNKNMAGIGKVRIKRFKVGTLNDNFGALGFVITVNNTNTSG